MKLELAPRLNLITGDNGLGKSFLLDVAWWALTRKWPQDLNAGLTSGYTARPTNPAQPATIALKVKDKAGNSVDYESPYVTRDQVWRGRQGRPYNPGIVLYALADGGFAVWDPHRNYWRTKAGVDVQERVPAYVFGTKDVWDGLTVEIDGKPTRVCNGVIADWANWIREKGADARRMEEALELLGPALGSAPMRSGSNFARLSVNDARDIPTVRMPYGSEIPIVYASLGVRRITALAYILCWAWREHVIAAGQLVAAPSSRLVLLFDEIEAHLHPRWQRAIVPALLKVVQALTEDSSATVQLIAATHSPLVLASLEPLFDPDCDAWFDLDLEGSEVHLRKRPFVRRGTANRWLASEAFNLPGEGRSMPAEQAILDAQKLLEARRSGTPVSAEEIDGVDDALRRVLSDIDPFWIRWSAFVEQLKGASE